MDKLKFLTDLNLFLRSKGVNGFKSTSDDSGVMALNFKDGSTITAKDWISFNDLLPPANNC